MASNGYYAGDTSDSDTEPKYTSSSAGQTSPQLRRDSRTDRIDRWYSNNEEGFHQRVLVPQYRYSHESRPRYEPRSPASDTSSLAMTAGSRSTYYDSLSSSRPPSLTSSRTDRRSTVSTVRTDSIASMPNQYIFEVDEDGTPIARDTSASQGRFQCPLAFLGCRHWFDDPSQWETHHQAHFRGHLPRSIHCPFAGCGERFRGESSREAWERRWSHIVNCQYRTSGVDARPTQTLIDHLWRKGIISNAQEQMLRQAGSLSNSSAYLETNSTSRDRRRERRPEDYRSPRSAGHGGGGSSYVLHR